MKEIIEDTLRKTRVILWICYNVNKHIEHLNW